MTRKEIVKKALAGELTWIQAAEILHLTVRQVRRIRQRFAQGGEAALADRRRTRPGNRRISQELKQKVCGLYREKYFDFSALHFFEKLKSEHRLQPASYSTVLGWLQSSGLLPKGARSSAHRLRRERRPMAGMLLHLDGSTHAWLGEAHPNFDLLAVVDDATTEVYAAGFFAQENTWSCMSVIRETIEKKGIFCSIYTDRATHFVVTLKGENKPDRSRPTQVSRALDRLGIELIHAYSPQARGRGERLWRTWQGRLPQELRLAGIQTMKEANHYLRSVFVPAHNRQFTVPARELLASAFVPLASTQKLDQIFSIQTSRCVNSDNTVQYKKLILQIPKLPSLRFSFAGVRVLVHEHADQSLSVTYGPHLLAQFSPSGQLQESDLPPISSAA